MSVNVIASDYFRYDAGDHVAIYPANDAVLVDKIGSLLNIDLDSIFSLVNLDGTSFDKFMLENMNLKTLLLLSLTPELLQRIRAKNTHSHAHAPTAPLLRTTLTSQHRFVLIFSKNSLTMLTIRKRKSGSNLWLLVPTRERYCIKLYYDILFWFSHHYCLPIINKQIL